jgi:photosystem I reaction center subunit XII
VALDQTVLSPVWDWLRRFHLLYNYLFTCMPLSDTQVFVALFVALITGILSVRLGTQLYK